MFVVNFLRKEFNKTLISVTRESERERKKSINVKGIILFIPLNIFLYKDTAYITSLHNDFSFKVNPPGPDLFCCFESKILTYYEAV